MIAALAYEQHKKEGVGIVGGDRGGYLLDDRRLAGAWRGYDKAALTEAHRREQVDEAHGEVGRLRSRRDALKLDAPGRMYRREIVELHEALPFGGQMTVYGIDAGEGERTLLAAIWTFAPGVADGTIDDIAGADVEAADVVGRNVHVIWQSGVAGLFGADEPKAVRHHLHDTADIYDAASADVVAHEFTDGVVAAEYAGEHLLGDEAGQPCA